jgi:hypothetical protein
MSWRETGLLSDGLDYFFFNFAFTALKRMGKIDMPMIPKTTVSKWSCTQGIDPNKYPSVVMLVTQSTAPAMQ